MKGWLSTATTPPSMVLPLSAVAGVGTPHLSVGRVLLAGRVVVVPVLVTVVPVRSGRGTTAALGMGARGGVVVVVVRALPLRSGPAVPVLRSPPGSSTCTTLPPTGSLGAVVAGPHGIRPVVAMAGPVAVGPHDKTVSTGRAVAVVERRRITGVTAGPVWSPSEQRLVA